MQPVLEPEQLFGSKEAAAASSRLSHKNNESSDPKTQDAITPANTLVYMLYIRGSGLLVDSFINFEICILLVTHNFIKSVFLKKYT